MLMRTMTVWLCLCLAACASVPTQPVSSIVVVRHAEKATDDPRDPVLSGAGMQRADALATVLAAEPLVAIYTTPLRRTRQTAQPTADAHHLASQDYAADIAPAALAAQLHQAHPKGTVLVVGHSNTVPDIVAALCACQVAPLDETEYGDVFRIVTDKNGKPALQRGRFGQ